LPDLLAYSGQLAAIVAVAAVSTHLLRLRGGAAVLAFWQGLLFACLLLPFGQPRPVDPRALVERAQHSASLAAAPAPPREPALPGFAGEYLPELALAILAAGVAARLTWLGVGLLGLRRMRRGATALPLANAAVDAARARVGVAADVYVSDRTTTPISFGLWRPVVLLPPGVLALDAEAQEAILCHELLHVRRRDWLWLLAEELACALLWFHPAMWWLVGRIHLTREQVVDRAVVALMNSRDTYLDALLAVARARQGARFAPVATLLRRGMLKKRIAEILKETKMTKRRLLSSLAACALAIAAATGAAVKLLPLEARAEAAELEPGNAMLILLGGEHLLHVAPAEYPSRAAEKGVSGDVMLEISIDERGHVSDARVLSGAEELRSGALQWVLKWHYGHPAPMPSTRQVLLRFVLSAADGAGGDSAPEAAEATAEASADRLKRQALELRKALEDAQLQGARQDELRGKLAETEALLATIVREKQHEAALHESERARLHREFAEEAARDEHLSRLKAQLVALEKAWAERSFAGEDTDRRAREIEELKAGLEELSPERRAGIREKLVALRLRDDGAYRAVERGATGTLVAIRSERIAEEAWSAILPRLDVREGDTLDEPAKRRIIERLRAVDEHLRAFFHDDGEGRITLIVMAPMAPPQER
jgi:TonB family protein